MPRPQRLDLVIYDAYRDGHRRDYFRVLRRALGGQVVWGPPARRWPVLLAAKKLVCATCDDYMPAFFLLALLRLLMGRRTVGLSVRSETIFQRHGAAQRIKQVMLRLLKWMPGADLITLMPYWVEPRLAGYSRDWMYDLQYWDLRWLSTPTGASLAAIQSQLQQAAAGRQIVASIGHQRRIKGVEYFMALYQQPPISERYLFVCIGPNWDVDRDLVRQFEQGGGLFFDMPLRDDQILPVYRLADIVWACYRSDYDQSSGIFGRAMQLGRPTVVRAGSYLATLQQHLCEVGFKIPYGDAAEAALRMTEAPAPRRPDRQIEPARADGLLRQRLRLSEPAGPLPGTRQRRYPAPLPPQG